MELSVLCECEIALVIFNEQGKLYKYSSSDVSHVLRMYMKASQSPHEIRSNDDVRTSVFFNPSSF
jgi:hypothetical protein